MLGPEFSVCLQFPRNDSPQTPYKEFRVEVGLASACLGVFSLESQRGSPLLDLPALPTFQDPVRQVGATHSAPVNGLLCVVEIGGLSLDLLVLF